MGKSTKKPVAVKAIWPDGSVTEARSAQEFILRMAGEQWTATTHQGMKNQLSKRAQAWGGYYIHPYQPDESFLRELHRTGLFKLSENGVDL
jgi:hypothetical protein